MLTIPAIYISLLGIYLVWMVLIQHHRGEQELFTLRNIVLAGFILFQTVSPATYLFTGDFRPYYIERPFVVAIEFCAMATVFVFLLLFAYRKAWGIKSLARRIPIVTWEPSATALVPLAIMVTISAAALRLGVEARLVGALTNQISIGFSALACGMMAWIWARRMANPMVIVLLVAIVGFNFLLQTSSAFGRRGIVAVGGAFLWGMYFSHFWKLPTRSLIARVFVLSIPAILAVAIFTSVRHPGHKDRTIAGQIERMLSSGDLADGLLRLAQGQDAGAASMWIIENYPENFSYNHLMVIRFLLVYPIPRDMWPSKPWPLSYEVPTNAALERGGGFNIGPGIVGHAAAEGGWYALILYALVGGLFIRLLDEILLRAPNSPFIVLPIGASLGEAIGLARGETSQLTFMLILAIVSSYIIMILCAKIAESLKPDLAVMSTQEEFPEEDEEEYWEDDPECASDGTPL